MITISSAQGSWICIFAALFSCGLFWAARKMTKEEMEAKAAAREIFLTRALTDQEAEDLRCAVDKDVARRNENRMHVNAIREANRIMRDRARF